MTLSELQDLLQSQYGVCVQTLSWGDTLLYASFLHLGSEANGNEYEDTDGEEERMGGNTRIEERTVQELLVRALAASQDDQDSNEPAARARLRDRLRGQTFILLEVTGAKDVSAVDSDTGDAGGGGEDVRIPPLKLFL